MSPRWLSPELRLSIICLLLVTTILSAAAVQTQAADVAPDPDSTVIRIHIQSNGTAECTIEFRTRLESDSKISEYRAFQDHFRNNRVEYVNRFRNRSRRFTLNRSRMTGRPMAVQDISATTYIQEFPRRYGVVTYKFTWVNAGMKAPNGSVVVDGVVGPNFFLEDDDTLEIIAPDDYQIADASPDSQRQTETVIVWGGPEDFVDGRPSVRFEQMDEGEATSTATDASIGSQLPARHAPALGGILFVGLSAYIYSRRQNSCMFAALNRFSWRQSTPESAMNDPIVTDQDEVLALLQRHDGRMRQADIADELGWSSSKTSRVLSSMHDDGHVEKLPIGRENVISLPETSIA